MELSYVCSQCKEWLNIYWRYFEWPFDWSQKPPKLKWPTFHITLTRTSRKSQKTSYKLQTKLKYQIPMSNKTITFSDFVWEFENWILEITCYLGFDISNSAKKWQKITCQLLIVNSWHLLESGRRQLFPIQSRPRLSAATTILRLTPIRMCRCHSLPRLPGSRASETFDIASAEEN